MTDDGHAPWCYLSPCRCFKTHTRNPAPLHLFNKEGADDG